VDGDVSERGECVGYVGRFKGILATRTLGRELGIVRMLLLKANFKRHAVGQMPVIIFIHMSVGITVQQCYCRRLGPFRPWRTSAAFFL
jgi:hypothetical protein